MATQKKRDALPFAKFGRLLVQRRQEVGIAQQADLAELLGIAQQTVSRWERGVSRPRANEIPALARAVEADSSELMAAAGYSAKGVAVSFVQPFPVDSLSAEDFERFAHYFLAKRFPPPAKVHRAGGPGHAQEGVDLDVILPDGSIFTFQCKRVEEFGPQKVHAAVAKHKRKAKKKFILLARVASPQARQAILEHKGWQLWDKEDIAREVRDLSADDQRRLVDIFFRGQRMALLGTDVSSPWQTGEDFFLAFMNRKGAFNHTWELKGRSDEMKRLQEALVTAGVAVVNLEGPGGAGKTRVLKDVVERFQADHPRVLVRFLSPTSEATQESLLELGEGPKLLIVDDAHERGDLGLLFQYVAVPDNNAKLFLSYRTYGSTYVEREAGRFALVGDRAARVGLSPLSKKDAVALALQVLKERNGPIGEADNIAQLTRDCPLATVLGAHVVASDGRHFEFAKNEGTFRETLLAKFYDVAAGTIGDSGDHGPIRSLLRVLALLQPFNAEDPRLLDAIQKIEGLEPHHVARLIRTLSESGILFRRGGPFRISPDLLADYIIEQKCIAHDGASAGYAERVFDAVGEEYLENLVVNLGKLDWRRSNGNPSNSRLLDGIWAKLAPASDYGDPHLKAVLGVAFYQPARTLKFVTEQVRAGTFLRELPPILKNVAYNLVHLPEACEILWHLGRDDQRETNPHPEHAMRILQELCKVAPGKPVRYNEVVVDFGLRLLDEPDSWQHRFTPFDFLSGILEVEGHTTSATWRTVTWSSFQVNPAFATPSRKKVVAAILRLLTAGDSRTAFRAAKELGHAVRYAIGGKDREKWTVEFAKTLSAVLDLVRNEKIEPVVLLEIVRSVSWHAQHGDGAPADIAKQIIAALPATLEFRTTLALVDGYGMLTRRMGENFAADRRELAAERNALAEELIREFPSGVALQRFLHDLLSKISAHDPERQSSPHEFLHILVQNSAGLAEAVVADALSAEPGATARFVHIALGALLVTEREKALRFAERMRTNGDAHLLAAVGFAYGINNMFDAPDENDLENLRALLRSCHERALHAGISALRSIKSHPRVLIELLKEANLGLSAPVTDGALLLLQGDKGELLPELEEKDVVGMLKRISPLDELDGPWLEEFLALVSKAHPRACAEFFTERVERAFANDNWHLRPVNHGPYLNVPLKFRESPEFGKLLVQVARWMASKENPSYLFKMRSAELFNAMFAPLDAPLVAFLADWIETANENELRVVGHILREGPQDLVFREKPFILRYLARCRQFGAECYKRASSDIISAAVSGTRSGTPGEPFPKDVRLKEEATEALKSIPRFAPGRDLYEDLLKYAEHSIRQQLREAEAFEDE